MGCMTNDEIPRAPSPEDQASLNTKIAELALRQHGAFTKRQAFEAGFSRHQIAHRLSSGLWIRVQPSVYRMSGTPESRAFKACAGLLYAGDSACFSHATAARMHGIDPGVGFGTVWLTVPACVARSRRPGLWITRSRRLDGFTTTVNGFPTVTAGRMIVDLAALLDRDALTRVLYDAVSQEKVTIDEVLAAAEDFGGRPGVALVHEITTTYDPAFESGLESEAAVLIREAGMIMERQVEVRDDGILLARLDFADDAIKLAFEIDGARFHSSTSARRYDRERDRVLRLHGWHVERFTTDDVRRNPVRTQRLMRKLYDDRVAEHLRAA